MPDQKPSDAVPAVPKKGKVYRLGEEYIVNFPRRLGTPRLGKIVVMTTEPGRHIGVEFDKPVPESIEDLEGRVKPGHGMWVHPGHLLTESEYQAQVAQRAAHDTQLHKSVDELVFDFESGAVA